MKLSLPLLLLVSVAGSMANEDRNLREKGGGNSLPKPGQACRHTDDCAFMSFTLQKTWAQVTSGEDLKTKCCSMNEKGWCRGYDPEYGCFYGKK